MKHVRPLPEKDFVETMASWPIVRWTVPRLGIARLGAYAFLTDCRRSSAQILLSKRKITYHNFFSPYGPIYFVARAPNLLDVPASAARKLTRRQFIFGGAAAENLASHLNQSGSLR